MLPVVSIITGRGCPRALRQILGVAGEGNAGVIDETVMHRRRDDGIEFMRESTVDRTIKDPEHEACVPHVELAGDAGRCERMVLDREAAGDMRRMFARVINAQGNLRTHRLCALFQERAIGESYKLAVKRLRGDCEAQLRADPGRLACGERDSAVV